MYRAHRTPALIVPALVCALVSPAAAQTRSGSRAGGESRDAATDTFVQGVRAYEAQDYNRALTIFQDVYVRTQQPEVLFNIGMTQQQLNHPTDAVRAFRQYLTRLPNAPNRAAVESRIALLGEQIHADEEAARARAAVAISPDPNSGAPGSHEVVRVHRPVAALVVGGVGVLSLAGSLTFALLRLDAIGNCQPNGSTLECPSTADAMRAERGRGYTIATDVTLGVGLAAVTAGVLWYLLGARTERVRVAFDASPENVGLRIGGSF